MLWYLVYCFCMCSTCLPFQVSTLTYFCLPIYKTVFYAINKGNFCNRFVCFHLRECLDSWFVALTCLPCQVWQLSGGLCTTLHVPLAESTLILRQLLQFKWMDLIKFQDSIPWKRGREYFQAFWLSHLVFRGKMRLKRSILTYETLNKLLNFNGVYWIVYIYIY